MIVIPLKKACGKGRCPSFEETSFGLLTIKNIFRSWVVHMCDTCIMTLGEKGNVLELTNHWVYERTDGQPNSSIEYIYFIKKIVYPQNFVARV
jgi:hypothetical protein